MTVTKLNARDVWLLRCFVSRLMNRRASHGREESLSASVHVVLRRFNRAGMQEVGAEEVRQVSNGD